MLKIGVVTYPPHHPPENGSDILSQLVVPFFGGNAQRTVLRQKLINTPGQIFPLQYLNTN